MNIENKIIDLVAGELPHNEVIKLKNEIASNPDAQKLYDHYKHLFNLTNKESINFSTPSRKLQSRFEATLREETNKQTTPAKIIGLQVQTIKRITSIAAILIIGVMIGQFAILQKHDQKTNKEIVFLRSQIEDNIGSSSVSTRIKAVNFSKQLPSEDPTILEVIIKIAKQDKNANVRLAATQALSNHLSASMVPKALGEMLLNEKDPAVLIAIIEALSNVKSKDILQSLEKITTDENLPKFVKDEAHNGITILQHGETL